MAGQALKRSRWPEQASDQVQRGWGGENGQEQPPLAPKLVHIWRATLSISVRDLPTDLIITMPVENLQSKADVWAAGQTEPFA